MNLIYNLWLHLILINPSIVLHNKIILHPTNKRLKIRYKTKNKIKTKVILTRKFYQDIVNKNNQLRISNLLHYKTNN